MFSSAYIISLAQRLHALMPPGLQRWTGEPTDATAARMASCERVAPHSRALQRAPLAEAHESNGES